MNDNTTNITALEKMFHDAPKSDFPSLPQNYAENTKPFDERYGDLKKQLGNRHDAVETGALLASVKSGVPYDELVYLNQHGKGHVSVVMNRAAELIDKFDKNLRLSGFEIFLLLCAIQIHDIGNINGRNNHTTSFKHEFYNIALACFIKEAGLKEMIFQIACAHGSTINGSDDTIAKLHSNTKLLNLDIRPRLLAAVLRFADELADDCTRAKELDGMPESSRIFHAYSKTLHSVNLEKNENNDKTYHIRLGYSLEQEQAIERYKGKEREISLIEEILNRTVKMERERRYCMRFLIPNIIITEIKVEIDVNFLNEILPQNYRYTLSEGGYPNTEIDFPERMNIIEKTMEYSNKHKNQ